MIALTLEPPSDGTTHWSARRIAPRVGMSITTVQRIWAEAGLKPHRTETFKFSTDPQLEAKVRDVVGLYLAPPERAIVLSVDEKTQIQALDRTAPMLPAAARPGRAPHPRLRAQRHDQPVRRARGRDGHGDPARPGRATPAPTSWPSCAGSTGSIPTASCTSSSTTSAPTRRRPSGPGCERHPRITFHFTPTSASWMNQVETWFGVLTRQAIRRGSFRLGQGADRPDRHVHRAAGTPGSTPFVWVKTADEILAKAVRKDRAINESRH